jgi:hypothetical protein
LGNNTHAEKHFAQAIALSPHDGYVFYNWGAYLHRQNRLADALKAYETAYRLDPTLVGAKQAADALRRAAPVYTPTPSSPQTAYAPVPPSSQQTPYAPTPTATPPPVQPADLYTPAASRYRNARGCISAGVLLALFGLCVPPVGLVGGLILRSDCPPARLGSRRAGGDCANDCAELDRNAGVGVSQRTRADGGGDVA